ncbi:hypothetical protein CPC08DRAFT_814909 [Agrocybe pediades]|nr:hypothetical protein CPC08DRAFT_814909 [Agrocybe pediades]
MSPPPVFPANSVYTRCYCEENVYLLCDQFLKDTSVTERWEAYAVFISNENKTAALWYQKAARVEGNPVIWDYHVILVLRPRNEADTLESLDSGSLSAQYEADQSGSWVYDFDTTLPVPCQWEDYLSLTFPEGLLPAYESKFRVVPGVLFLQHFASDRSHMIVKPNSTVNGSTDTDALCTPAYSASPPTYAPICGKLALKSGISHNLMTHYVAMKTMEVDESQAGNYGFVLDRDKAEEFFSMWKDEDETEADCM